MKSEIKHRMTRRLNGWDYCQRAIYSITVTLADRSRPWLGQLNILAKNGEEQNIAKNGEARNGAAGAEERAARSVAAHSCAASISPTPFGEAMIAALKEMPRLYPEVRLIEWQVMPEHFHFILFVVSPLPKPLGALVRGFKAGAAAKSPSRSMAPTFGGFGTRGNLTASSPRGNGAASSALNQPAKSQSPLPPGRRERAG